MATTSVKPADHAIVQTAAVARCIALLEAQGHLSPSKPAKRLRPIAGEWIVTIWQPATRETESFTVQAVDLVTAHAEAMSILVSNIAENQDNPDAALLRVLDIVQRYA